MTEKANRRLGQNFLVSTAVAARILDVAEIAGGDHVLEIGPGRGALTGPLLERGARVLAVEIDPLLIAFLRGAFPDHRHLRLYHRDILKIDLPSLLGDDRWKLVSNLPYYEATAILQHVIGVKNRLDSATVMIQREVAQRLLAKPGNRQIGYLSHLLGYHFHIRHCFNVKPGSFRPAPKVHSSVIQLIPHRETASLPSYRLYLSLLQQAFGHRRKTLINALRQLPIESQGLERLLLTRGLDRQVRAESLSSEDFVWLARELFPLQSGLDTQVSE